MDVISAAERLAAIDRSEVTFDPKRCLHSRDKYSECEACFQICPLGAIQPAKPPAFEAENCDNCLACLPVCPAGAYSADDALPALLNCAARAEVETIELLCELHPEPESGLSPESLGIQVRACLAGLGPGSYLGLAALGFKVIARTETCGECPLGKLTTQIHLNIEAAQRLLTHWNWGDRLASTAGEEPFESRLLWDAENPPISRRDLFQFASRQGQTAAARAIAKDEQLTGKRPPRERRRVISAIAHLPQIENGSNPTLENLGFAVLSVSDACSGCSACARACPTGSLVAFGGDKESFRLEFTPPTCTVCGICAHFCAQEAITLNSAPTFEEVFGSKEPLVLFQAEMKRCQRCNTSFTSKEDARYCPMCEFRLQNPFGSRLPPHLLANKKD
jgi:Fe-S-cluster-containing hydrogenase component 2